MSGFNLVTLWSSSTKVGMVAVDGLAEMSTRVHTVAASIPCETFWVLALTDPAAVSKRVPVLVATRCSKASPPRHPSRCDLPRSLVIERSVAVRGWLLRRVPSFSSSPSPSPIAA